MPTCSPSWSMENTMASRSEEDFKSKSRRNCCWEERGTSEGFLRRDELCDKPGCQDFINIDADLKPHRMLCAAKLCGVREFCNSKVRLVTGCTAVPGTKNKFCFKHRNEESPVLTGEEISSGSRESPKSHRKENASSTKAQDDQVYIIWEHQRDERGRSRRQEIQEVWVQDKWLDFQMMLQPGNQSKIYPDLSRASIQRRPNKDLCEVAQPHHRAQQGSAKYHLLSWVGNLGGAGWRMPTSLTSSRATEIASAAYKKLTQHMQVAWQEDSKVVSCRQTLRHNSCADRRALWERKHLAGCHYFLLNYFLLKE